MKVKAPIPVYLASAFAFGLFGGWLISSWSLTEMTPSAEVIGAYWTAQIDALIDESAQLREPESVVSSNHYSFLALTTALGFQFDGIKDKDLKSRILARTDRAGLILDALEELNSDAPGIAASRITSECVSQAKLEENFDVERCVKNRWGS